MAKDKIGNELAQGHLVQVKLDSPEVLGKIREIQTGGLAIPGQGPNAQVTPGVLVIGVDIMVPFNPQNPRLPTVLLVVNPEEKKPSIVQ
jgi:hypothetical protein